MPRGVGAGWETSPRRGSGGTDPAPRRWVRLRGPRHPRSANFRQTSPLSSCPPDENPHPKPQQALAGMLQERNKSLSFPSHNPGPDVKQPRDAAGPKRSYSERRRTSAVLRLQIHPETQSVGKREPCPAAQISSFHVFPLLPATSGPQPGQKKTPLRSRSGPRASHRRPPRRRDAGYVPPRRDFPAGGSAGLSCSRPSLIIPVVIISLNSRRLEGKPNNNN